MNELVDGRPWAEWLAERPLAVIATVGADGFAHAVPVEVVAEQGFVYVWAHRTSRKIRNARREGRASLVCYKGRNGVLVAGSATILDSSSQEYGRITSAFLEKYSREETYGNDALLKISPGRVTPFAG